METRLYTIWVTLYIRRVMKQMQGFCLRNPILKDNTNQSRLNLGVAAQYVLYDTHTTQKDSVVYNVKMRPTS
jgi:hypothetical protein